MKMKIGVLGTGVVGETLANGFLQDGHEVMLGSRDASSEKLSEWGNRQGDRASTGDYAEAAAFGNMIVLATRGVATEEALRMAGPANFTGKIVIDPTNPLDFSEGFPPKLTIGHTDSLGEVVQRTLPGAHVVKCFNTVGHDLMVRPQIEGGPPTMFICGNDATAKKHVREILESWNWEVSDIGGIEASRFLEPMCAVWVLDAARDDHWIQAFKMLR